MAPHSPTPADVSRRSAFFGGRSPDFLEGLTAQAELHEPAGRTASIAGVALGADAPMNVVVQVRDGQGRGAFAAWANRPGAAGAHAICLIQT